MISKMFLFLLIFFIDNIIPVISSTQIACTSCVYNMYRSSHRRCSLKKMFLKILLILQENTRVGASFFNNVTGLKACSFTPSLQLHHSSATEDSSTVKEQELTKHCFLPHRFSTESLQYQY